LKTQLIGTTSQVAPQTKKIEISRLNTLQNPVEIAFPGCKCLKIFRLRRAKTHTKCIFEHQIFTLFFIVVQKTNGIIGAKPSKILFFSGSYEDILSN
jgi:hypothetical protein